MSGRFSPGIVKVHRVSDCQLELHCLLETAVVAMNPIRLVFRVGVTVFVVSLLLVFVGVESGCDSGSKGPGMVTDPPPPPPAAPVAT